MHVEHEVVEGTLSFLDVRQGLLGIAHEGTHTDFSLRTLPLRALERLQVGSEVTLLVQHTSEFAFPEVLAAQRVPECRPLYLGPSMAWHTIAIGVGLLALALYARTLWLFVPAAIIGALYVTLAVRRSRTLRTFAERLAERPPSAAAAAAIEGGTSPTGIPAT